VLLTGATGFVGSFLAEDLVKNGFEVFVTIRKSSDLQWIKELPLQLIYLNLQNEEEIFEFLEKNQIKYVIHNAGLTRHPSELELNHVNAEILNNFINAINKLSFSISKFIFISSLAAYGSADSQKGGIVDRNSIPRPLTAYGRSKLLAESYLKNQQFNYIIFRPTAVYGPREKDLYTLFKTLNARLDVSIGSGQKLTFIYVKDLSKLIVNSLTRELKYKDYFASDMQLYDSNYFSTIISNKLNKKTIKITLPSMFVKTICNMNDMLGKIFKFHPLLNSDKFNEISAASWNCDASEIWEELNMKPEYLLERGVGETVEWYTQNNWL
jgi:nucleoside-diphosphate-sugar epimerase